METRRGPSTFELLGPVSYNEESLLTRVGVNKKLFEKKNSYYCERRKSIWIGKVSDEIPEGNGVLIMADPKTTIIVVDMKDGQKDGIAKVYFEDGSYFQTTFRKDEFDGSTEYYSSDHKKILSATFLTDRNVEIVYNGTGETYVGSHVFLSRSGRGKLFKDISQTMEGIKFDGVWANDKFVEGYARIDFYIGEIVSGVYHGNGCEYFEKNWKKKKLEGPFQQGRLNGWGREYYNNSDNEIKYEGSMTDGVYDGDGSLTELEPVKRTYKGKFRKGVLNSIVDIFDELGRPFQKKMYKDGEVIELIEEYYFNIVFPSIKEIDNSELKSGSISTLLLEKAIYNHQLSSVKYYNKFKDETPSFMMQVEPKLFSIKYEGILNHGGALAYSGDMKNIVFHGKGILRYDLKNEPRKYVGDLMNGLFNGRGELYSHQNQLLYSGQFDDNRFNGDGVLVIHSIPMVGNEEVPQNGLFGTRFAPDLYDVEIDGKFYQGKFQGGVWRYTGKSENVIGKQLQIKVSKKSDILLGKMYSNKTILFEGVFEHYSFNGKGTLYYKDGTTMKYQGEFKDGVFWGAGVLYDHKGKSIYEGNFENGCYHGMGILYQGIEENLIYKGEFVQGQMIGNGKMVEKDGKTIRSEGVYKNGKLNKGFIRIFDPATKALQYEGNILNGLYEGEGIIYINSKIIKEKGTFKTGELVQGTKREYFHNGNIDKDGEVHNGKYEGKVKEYYFDGKLQYEGNYEKGERSGQGVMYHKNGKIKQIGTFKDNVFYEGDALYYHEDNTTLKFEGKIQNMYYNGIGKKYHDNGFIEYEGNFKNGLFEGNGTYYYPETKGQIKFKGEFREGVPKGEGSYYDLRGNLIYQGGMNNWKKSGDGVVYGQDKSRLLEGKFEEDEIFKGKGKVFWPGFGTVKFEGEFDNGFQEGIGKSYYTNGYLEYEGQFKGNYPDGVGTYYSEDERGRKKYNGCFQRGKFHGTGFLIEDQTTYEGEFSKGKKHGYGILKYINPMYGTKFEGRFSLDDMEEGKLMLRDNEGKLLYEGSVRKNLYEGEGTKYYTNGKVEYKGIWKEGYYEQEGTKFFDNGVIEYEGEFSKGFYHGKGKLYRKDKSIIYDGNFFKGNFAGQGTLYDEKNYIIYTGNLKSGQYHGKGQLYFPKSTNIRYTGSFSEGKFEGDGEKTSKKLYKKYIGKFSNGKFDGMGVLYYPDGATIKYSGVFKQKKYQGFGVLYNQSGNAIYKGEFENGEYNGKGILFYKDSDKIYYEGSFIQGRIEGEGEFRFQNGNVHYRGQVKSGLYHGRGILYHEDGKVKHEGNFVNGNY